MYCDRQARHPIDESDSGSISNLERAQIPEGHLDGFTFDAFPGGVGWYDHCGCGCGVVWCRKVTNAVVSVVMAVEIMMKPQWTR